MAGAKIAVYVPKRGTDSGIAGGSGIVGTPLMQAGDILIDYEGNLHGAENIRTYADRVMIAAARHITSYPTIARRVVTEAEMVEVGEFDGDCVNIYADRGASLAAWLGLGATDLLDPHDLLVSERHAS